MKTFFKKRHLNKKIIITPDCVTFVRTGAFGRLAV